VNVRSQGGCDTASGHMMQSGCSALDQSVDQAAHPAAAAALQNAGEINGVSSDGMLYDSH